MMKKLTIILLIIFLLTLPILILWHPTTIKVTYSLVNLPADKTNQAAEVINNLYQPGFTPAEISHLEDVSHLVKTTQIICFIALTALIIIWFYHHRQKTLPEFYMAISLSSKYIIILIAISILFFGLFWNSTFTTFHQIFFPQGNWAFPADSLLITLFPEIFWQFIFVVYLSLVIITSLIILILNHFLDFAHR